MIIDAVFWCKEIFEGLVYYKEITDSEIET